MGESHTLLHGTQALRREKAGTGGENSLVWMCGYYHRAPAVSEIFTHVFEMVSAL